MNPLGLLIAFLGVMIVIIGFKGSQHRVMAAFTNKTAK